MKAIARAGIRFCGVRSLPGKSQLDTSGNGSGLVLAMASDAAKAGRRRRIGHSGGLSMFADRRLGLFLRLDSRFAAN